MSKTGRGGGVWGGGGEERRRGVWSACPQPSPQEFLSSSKTNEIVYFA